VSIENDGFDSEMDNDSKRTIGFVGMSCSETELLVDDYVDSELNEIDTRRFERHVSSCSGCAEILQDTERVLSAARMLAERPISPAVSERLRARLREELGISLATNKKPRLSLVE